MLFIITAAVPRSKSEYKLFFATPKADLVTGGDFPLRKETAEVQTHMICHEAVSRIMWWCSC